LAIFTYAFHSSSDINNTRPLHIVVHHYFRNREDEEKERRGGYWWDCESGDYGALMESECDLKGVLLHTSGEIIRDQDYDLSMGLRKFHELFGGGIGGGKVHFFMPPLLRESMSLSIKKSLIPEDRICDKCNETFETRLKELRNQGNQTEKEV
jgi:hypothetical protein